MLPKIASRNTPISTLEHLRDSDIDTTHSGVATPLLTPGSQRLAGPGADSDGTEPGDRHAPKAVAPDRAPAPADGVIATPPITADPTVATVPPSPIPTTAPDTATAEFAAEYPLERLRRIFRPISFAIGSGEYSSSCEFDQALMKAFLGDPGPLTKLNNSFEVQRAGFVMLDFGVTRFDAWAFDRADRVAVRALPVLGRLADFGILTNARQPDTGRTLAHVLVDWDQGPEMWNILARGGVNFDLPDNRGQTALCQARDNNNVRLMRTLVELGADTTVFEMTRPETIKFLAQFAA